MATGKHGDVEDNELRVRGAVSPAFAAIVAAFRQGDAVETVDLQFQGIGVEQVENLSQAIVRHGRMNEISFISTINLSGNRFGDNGVRLLLPALTATSNVFLADCDIGPTGAKLIGSNLQVAPDRHCSLTLSGNPIGDVGLTDLAHGLRDKGSLQALHFLSLSQCKIGDAGIVSLAEAIQGNRSLVTLGLENNTIGSIGAVALAEVVKDTRLSYLNLRNNQIEDDGAEAFGLALQHNPSIESVDFQNNQIGDRGAAVLGACLRENKTLALLDLALNQIGNDGAVALAQLLHKDTALTKLLLASNEFGAVGVDALRVAATACNCYLDILRDSDDPSTCVKDFEMAIRKTLDNSATELDLFSQKFNRDRSIDTASLGRALKSNTSVRSMRFLGYYGDNGGVELGEALKTNKTLKTLHIMSNLPERDAVAIAEGLKVNTGLESLNLRLTKIDPTDGLGLKQNTTLKYLSLRGCSVTAVGAKDLAEALTQPSCAIQSLNLAANKIGDKGVEYIGAALTKNRRLQKLILQRNAIGVVGGQVLAESLRQNTTLEVLDLVDNAISDGAATVLAAALISTALRELHLASNLIGDPGAIALGAGLRQNRTLAVLNLTSNRICNSGATAIWNGIKGNRSLTRALSLLDNPIHVLDVSFLSTKPIVHVAVSFDKLAWPPPTLVGRCTPSNRSTVHRFLESTAVSSSPLMRTRLMLVGHGGSGKTTLKTALLLPTTETDAGCALAVLRESTKQAMAKWTEADVRSWVDNDLARVDGFFDRHCPSAIGISGARWLEYTLLDFVEVFGASKTELSRVVVKKMVSVQVFLSPERASTITEPVKGDSESSLGWLLSTLHEAIEHSAPLFAGQIGVDLPVCDVEQDTLPSEKDAQLARPYAWLLDIPHIWTEAIELEKWDEGDYTLWDMPGQMELYPAHQMFSASATAVYVLVVQASHGCNDCIAQLQRWLSALRLGLKSVDKPAKIQVRIVVSHTDELIELDRQALLREILTRAKRSFQDTFDFGSTCFATLYGEELGGSPTTGVAALKNELLQLRREGTPQFSMPTTYQRVCDEVVALSRTPALSHWPIVEQTCLDPQGELLADVLACLEDLGFLKLVDGQRMILEPVTWLSRLMVAFLHPFHGLAKTMGASAGVSTVKAHLQAVTVTGEAACRIVNHRHHVVDLKNQADILPLMAQFDVCFAIDVRRYVFPSLLPPVAQLPSWLRRHFGADCPTFPYTMHRYTCTRDEDTIPPTVTTLLLAAVVSNAAYRPVFFGRCTVVVHNSLSGGYVGVFQSNDDSFIDIFATGVDHAIHLGVVTLQLAVLHAKHYPTLLLNRKGLVSAVGDVKPESEDPFAMHTDHLFFGRCVMSPHDQAWHDMCSTVDVPMIAEWAWDHYNSVLKTSIVARTVSQSLGDIALPESWAQSALRQTLMINCPLLGKWIDIDIGDDKRQPPDQLNPLRGLGLLWVVLAVCPTPTRQPSSGTNTARVSLSAWEPDADDGAAELGITYDVLLEVYSQAQELAGDDFGSWTMRDVNNKVVKPLCARFGTSLALHHSPQGLRADVFVSHAWKEPFKDFVESIVEAFKTQLVKPTLWICTFALFQSNDRAVVAQQLGSADAPLRDAPFVRALRNAREILVVRNSAVDIYTRLWCVCEVLFAHEYGLVPGRVKVVGSNTFASSVASCLDAQCSDPGDRVRILHALIGGMVANPDRVREIDDVIRKFRQFTRSSMPQNSVMSGSVHSDDP